MTAERVGDVHGMLARGAILQAAARVFAEKGVEGATVEDILVEAGVSRRTYYKHFSGKEDALDALHEFAAELFSSESERAIEEAVTPREKLAACVGVYLAFAQRSGRLMLVLQGEAQRAGSRLAARRHRMMDRLIEQLQQGIKARHGRRTDRLVLEGLMLAMEGITRSMLEQGPLGEREVARARRAMLHILVGALGGEGEPLELPEE